MKAYNLYYKNNKINKRPLSKEAVDEIFKRTVMNKKINDTTVMQYNVKDIKVVECIIL